MNATTDTLTRDPAAAAAQRYDLIVVGGGIYGAAVTLEAARRGRRVLLIERDDFGQHTSWGSLRIVHGGLRYLQTLDLPRFFESVRERRWFLRHLPDAVRPLTCLMPLYGQGLKRPLTFGAALWMNHLLSLGRNAGVRADARLERGGILGPEETARLLPQVRREGLRGGGLWHDAFMLSSERVLIELLRWAGRCGAQTLNYTEATALLTEGGRVTGVEAVDHCSGATVRFAAPVVLTCGGPWSRSLSKVLDTEKPRLIAASLAFNLMLDRPPVSEAAVAVGPPRRAGEDGRMYFVLPWKGKVFAGTCHLAYDVKARGLSRIGPTEEEVAHFLDELNASLPDLKATRRDVIRIYAGVVPAVAEGSNKTSGRAVVVDHGGEGGPRGLVSVSGVKYTTARYEAAKALRVALGPLQRLPDPAPDAPRGVAARLLDLDGGTVTDAAALRTLAAEESVVHLDDLLLRRLDLTCGPDVALQLADPVLAALGWDAQRVEAERQRWARIVAGPAFGGPVAGDQTAESLHDSGNASL